MIKFVDTIHCASRKYCNQCRNDEGFRAITIGVHGEYKCPLDLPIPCDEKDLPEIIDIEIKQNGIVRCKFDKEKRCCGNPVECSNPEFPIKKVPVHLCGEGVCPGYIK